MLFNTALRSLTGCDHVCYTFGTLRAKQLQGSAGTDPSPSISPKKEYFKRFPERTFDLLQNPMQSVADVESKRPQLEREFRERKKIAQKPAQWHN